MLFRRTDIPFYRKKLGLLWGDACVVPVRPDWVATPMETVSLLPECVDRLIKESAALGISSIIFESHADYGLSQVQDLPERPTDSQMQPHEPNQMLELRINGLDGMDESDQAAIWELFSVSNGLIVPNTEQIVFLVTHDDVTLVIGQKQIVEGVCGLSVEQGLSWLAEFAERIGDKRCLAALYRNLQRYPVGFPGTHANLCDNTQT